MRKVPRHDLSGVCRMDEEMDLTSENRVFLTQSELANRWRVTQSSIKNWRERGQLCYFQLPGSSRILYPIEAVEEIEKKFTKPTKEVMQRERKAKGNREKHVVSANKDENWRI